MSGHRLLAYDPSQVKPGWIAFFIVLALLVATFLLWRSMNTQLNKIDVPHRDAFRPEPSADVDRTRAATDEDRRDDPSARS